MSDLLTQAGAAIKAVNKLEIAGHAIMFTDPWNTDREFEFFTRDSELDLVDRLSVKALWYHNLDKSVTEPLGRCSFQVQDEGVWAQLKLRNDDVGRRVFQLAERDELSWSSGSAAHLVRKEKVGNASWIAEWGVSEFSVLPRSCAAEPRARVTTLKSLSDACVKPLILSPKQRAQIAIAEYLATRREFERSQLGDDAAEMESYYNALARVQIDRYQRTLKQSEKVNS